MKGMTERPHWAKRTLPPFLSDLTIRRNEQRMRSTPISPGKIPGLSINSPRMGKVKETQETIHPKTATMHPTRRSRSKADMIYPLLLLRSGDAQFLGGTLRLFDVVQDPALGLRGRLENLVGLRPRRIHQGKQILLAEILDRLARHGDLEGIDQLVDAVLRNPLGIPQGAPAQSTGKLVFQRRGEARDGRDRDIVKDVGLVVIDDQGAQHLGFDQRQGLGKVARGEIHLLLR